MDNRIIEKFAANAVEENILDTDILHPEISENDKTLSWDGFIEVYKSNDKIKANFDGKVGIQVKGTMNNNHPKIISFSAETADLRNYLNNGGVIYFVVRIHKEHTSERKVYYESLTPVKLKQHLDGVKKQKTRTIKLKEFPTDKYERVSIILNFLQNSRKQSSYVSSGFIPLEDIYKKGYNYTIPISGYEKKGTNNLFSTILGKEVYAYITTEGSSALIPVDTPLTIREFSHKVEEKIYVGDKCYYDSYKRNISTEGIFFTIGDSITLIFRNFETNTVKTNIVFSPYLKKATKDMRFIIDALNANGFRIGSTQLCLNSFELETTDFISVTQKRLILFEHIIDLFNILNVSKDLNIHNLSENEQEYIEVLIKAFINKEHIKNLTKDIPTSVLDLKISNIILKLIILKNEDGTYIIQDFFNSEVAVSYKDEYGNNRITSPYSALSKDDWLCVANINYNCILESYKKVITQNSDVYDRANADMLQMLLAYDKTPNRKLLSIAQEIAYWILIEKKQLNKIINTLNYLQTIKRERLFNKEEIKQLYEITEDADASKQEKIGAYLLLDNNVLAEAHFDKLTIKEQEDFKLFPIFTFSNSSSG